MNRHFGRPYVAIPGPSVIPDRVLAAMMRPAPNIYTGEIHDLTLSLLPDLRALARAPEADVALYICNGHGAWEAAAANVFSRGDKALALATGRFGAGWGAAVAGMGVEVETLDFGRSSPVDPARLEAALRADPGHSIRAVLATHVDTASSVRNDIAALRACLDAVGHPALLMVDCIASLGTDPFEMEAWGVDVMVAARQKGLMCPAGMAFVWFNARARAAGLGADLRTPYWDWTGRADAGDEFYRYFAGTAPTHHLYALREGLTMLLHEEGLEAAWARHALLAGAVWRAVEVWGEGGAMALNVADPADRGAAVTSVRVGAPHGAHLRDWTEAEAGVVLGIGLGMDSPEDPLAEGWIRIAHMGHVNAHMTLGALAVIEAGLARLHVPRGRGAVEAAAAVIAGG
ncbi:MAG: aminotransferase class V-fold PLP-dependent enzyme [Rhodobacteraceae bacterium]|nr:aminotransferase class V-fold PLP-dependent enzyme [Paracoccaceae bacterium]